MPPSTFPLPDEDIRKEKLRALFTSPLVWVPQISILGMGLYLKWPVWLILAVMVGAFFVCALIWQARSGTLEKRITKRIIAKSNTEQDRELVAKIKQFEERDADGYAVTLSKFLELKQKIEATLHANPDTSDDEKAVEKTIDALCFGVAEELEAATELEAHLDSTSDPEEHRKLADARKELLARVIEGYKSLKKTKARLAARSRPKDASVGKSSLDLDAILADLRTEEEIAKNTRSRLRKDLGEN